MSTVSLQNYAIKRKNARFKDENDAGEIKTTSLKQEGGVMHRSQRVQQR